ncbi:GIY-YIG nuclease family protein [Nocardia cyriacigeorgica]|uniref:GIY-YIG nuclease family protein n=1 Tax=Nocardia cyriacigeorgica TaxID=135487 RepID=A0A5R8P566_9NOCA|nr:GIY-YIG nuclease family protein [Nocardia cyriacigeorgica]TLF92267.1 GIY-YIG nuclease family protein [Nocardia cyriacigeorgica]
MTPRLLRLRPWLIRALIPTDHIGTYLLYNGDGDLTYVGRSDTDIRRRLIRHSIDRQAEYFTYDIHHSVTSAFDVECALFHLHAGVLSNRLHPDKPDFHQAICIFCSIPQRRSKHS